MDLPEQAGEWLLREALAEEPRLLWKVNRYKKDIQHRRHRLDVGVRTQRVSTGALHRNVAAQPANPRYEKYVVDPKYCEDMWRAALVVERVFADPLSREELVADEALAALPRSAERPLHDRAPIST